ncbi:hypothetical protein V6B33_02015 [Mangrovibacillus sp. Mu-81]
MKYKTTPESQPIAEKEYSLRTVLNMMGIVIFGGILLQSLTVPIVLDGNGEFSQIEEIKMSAGKFVEFFLFTLGCGIIYYFLVNVYFMGKKWRRIFFISITLLAFFSIYMVFFYLLQHPLSH